MATAYPNKSERLAQQADASATIPRDLQCGYRSKICTSVRATKLDGTLHKLCEFHRLKANSSQRRLQKRRQQRKVEEASAGKHARDSDSDESATSVSSNVRRSAKRARVSEVSSPMTADTALVDGCLPYEFNASEMAILEQTLFSSSSTSATSVGSTYWMPTPLGVFDMDSVVADVLEGFSGPVSMAPSDVSSSWCWTV